MTRGLRMQLIAPDILAEAKGLSLPFSIAGVIVGLLLWTVGWRFHRFWIVFAATIAAGLFGMSEHQAISPRMLAAGILMALAAGMMAVDLSRFVAFAAGGFICWMIVHKILPTFQEPLICFLCGGILGVFLYRLQMMIVFSLAGTVTIV